MNADPGQARSWLSDNIIAKTAAEAFIASAVCFFA